SRRPGSHFRRRRPARTSTPSVIEASALAPDIPWETVDAEAEAIPFTAMHLDSRLMQGLNDYGFEGTRSVQGVVIPLALAGGDVVACAETGTGKTLAFAAPILQRLLH